MNAFVFLASEGWRGYSLLYDGRDLPEDLGPWQVFRNVRVHPDDEPYGALSEGRAYVHRSQDSLRGEE
jgi:hypothetical protein